MLHEGALFKRSEWDGCESADYELSEEQGRVAVLFQGSPINFELVDVDVCSHFEIEEIPEDWGITDVTDYIKSRMW